jgi:4-hydroxy-tetrahydrodipicolinate synthase
VGSPSTSQNTVQAMLKGGGDAEAQMRAAIAVVADAPFVPAPKAVLAAQSGEAGWLRVRPPLRPLHDGAARKAKLDALMRPSRPERPRPEGRYRAS